MPRSPRKPFRSLKPATQRRKINHYGKQGLTPSQVAQRYDSGSLGSQKAARGHRQTPEKPKEATRNQEKYRDYLERRQRLIDKVIEKKRAEFGDVWKYDNTAAEKAAKVNPATGKPPKLSYMQRFLDDDFDLSEVDWEDDDWSFIFYHSFAGD